MQTCLSILFFLIPIMLFGNVRGVPPHPQENIIYAETADGETIELYRNSYALVVGVSEYDNRKDLPDARANADSVAAALEKMGFIVSKLLNPTSEQLRNSLASYQSQVTKNDRFIFYFSGHGATEQLMTDELLGYIIPTGVPLIRTNRTAFQKKAINMREIALHAERLLARHALYIFDSCFSGTIFNLRSSDDPPPEPIREKTTHLARQFLTAGDRDEMVSAISDFTPYLIRGISGEADGTPQDGYVTGSELGEYIKGRLTSPEQHPQF
ncbi:MAG: caspase family protein, partial [Candidatus Electryoneaceae bacterium]|nr:caspase family protein [Candidatus Electryoneaceae bacterium]